MAREIIVTSYDPAWATQYEEAKTILEDVFEDILLEIHHIGSTSILGLAAKPTIDILVIVTDIENVDAYHEEMAVHGFHGKGEGGIPGRRYFYKTLLGNEFVETHHIHIYQKGNPKYQEELLFRDYLRSHDESAKQYETLKLDLAKRYRHVPVDYTNAKTDFVLQILEKARHHIGVNQCQKN